MNEKERQQEKKESNIFFRDNWIKEVLEKGEEQVKKELYDYWNLMGVHSKLLDRVTNGKMSKTNYTWEAVENVLNEIEKEIFLK